MSRRALTALTIVLPVEYPAELAADCMQLFSRIERLELRSPMRRRTAPKGEGENARRYCYAEAPPGLEAHVKVRQAHDGPQQTSHKDSPCGELRQITPIDVAKPLQFYLGRGFSPWVYACEVVQKNLHSKRTGELCLSRR